MAEIDDLLTAVTTTTKYQPISPDLIRRIGAEELGKRPRLKEAVKATKNKLHQIGGAYFEAKIDYEKMAARLRATAVSPADFQTTCRDLMRLHASTRERLDILDQFYATTLADLPPITSVLDIACGLNPLAWAWMPFDTAVSYTAYDIYSDMMAFLQEFMGLAGIAGMAQTRDVISTPPTEPVDLVLLLKTLPVLDQVDKTAVPTLFDTLHAKYLLISFPAQSLGGRKKGMVQNYEQQFLAWLNGRSWTYQRFQFPSELAYLVTTTTDT